MNEAAEKDASYFFRVSEGEIVKVDKKTKKIIVLSGVLLNFALPNDKDNYLKKLFF